MWASNSLDSSAAIQVGTCTPLVMALNRDASSGPAPGQMGAHIRRVTSQCRWLTALTAPADRSASAVMLNIWPSPFPLS